MSDSETREDGTQLSFWEHLTELRRRLVYIVAALIGGFIVAWILKEELFSIVSAPVREGLAAHGIHRLTAIETTEAVMVYLKLAMAAAIVVTIPVSLWQLWLFVKPGLVETELRPMRRIAILAVFMFVLGLLFCYRFVLPLVIDFLTSFTLGAGGVDFQVTMQSAYSTTFVFLVGFGVIFELPLVMVLLAATPLFDSAKYIKWIRYSIVIAFAIGSVLTPPDVLSQLLMAVPVTVLYVVGIGLTFLSERRQALGRPVASGPDWLLAGGILLLSTMIAAILLPVSKPVAGYLPYGARAILLTAGELEGDTGAPGCGGLLTATLRSHTAEQVCAVYPEGTLLLVTPTPEVEMESLCPTAVPGQMACGVAGEATVLGSPMLVARYLANRDQGLVDSDPLELDDDSHLSLFVSLESTPREQRAYLRVTEFEGDAEVHITLSFSDPREAEQFVLTLETDLAAVGQLAAPASPPGPTSLALEELAAALENLSSRLPPEEVTEVARHISRARALLKGEGSQTQSGAHGLLACRLSPCAYTYLAPHLPAPSESKTNGRVVSLEFNGEEVDTEALHRLLLGIVSESSQ